MNISIIIPVKNGEKYLRDCLDSVFSQSFKGDYEVILGIDPSTDKTYEIAKEYQKEHPNLIVEEREGRGVQYNRMESLKRAAGKYICFLDADDYYHKDYLKIMYEEIEKGYDVVNCSFFVAKNSRISKNMFTKTSDFDSAQGCKAILKDSYMRGFLWTKIYRRELFNQKLPVLKAKRALFEDTLLTYYVFMSAKKIRSIKTPLYYYRFVETSATKEASSDRFFYHLFAFAFIRHLCDINANPEYLKGFLSTMFRSKLSLTYDKSVSKKVLGEEGKQRIKYFKPLLKDLSKKEKLDIAKYPELEKYITETLN